MSGLKWVRLDATFPHNQKVLDLAEQGRWRAITAYVCGLAYAGSQGTDGWIPSSALHLIHARRAEAAQLVEVALWVPRPGGWDIHDWTQYQPTSEDTKARSEHARAAAMARWHGGKDNVRPIDKAR
jgi:hypothetical protein